MAKTEGSVAELEKALKSMPNTDKAEKGATHMNGKAKAKAAKAVKKAKAAPKAPPRERAPFAIRVGRYNERTKKYGFAEDEKQDFTELSELLSHAEKLIAKGQSNGLHEVILAVR